MEPNNRLRGFTLLELLIVMVIIGLLVSLVAPRFTGRLGESKIKTTKAQIELLSSALESYLLDVGEYPSTTQGLNALLKPPQSVEDQWNGPYLKKLTMPKDAWKNDFIYKGPDDSDVQEKGLDYIIASYGRDAKEGGDDENKDLYSYN